MYAQAVWVRHRRVRWHNERLRALVLLLALPWLVLPFAPQKAKAAPGDITVYFTATVRDVTDSDGLFGGAILIGDSITGHYTYNALARDSEAAPTVGAYWHTTTVCGVPCPYGISVDVGGFVFQTDPDNVRFLVEMVNDSGEPAFATDHYLLRSYNNLPLENGVRVHHISWQLDDFTHTALSSDALPTTPPTLSDWDPLSVGLFVGVRQENRSDGSINADVTAVSLTGPISPVSIDIKPGNPNNCLNSDGHGVIPVAVLGSALMDATQVDPATVMLDGQAVRVVGNGNALVQDRNVNGDAYIDRVFQIEEGDHIYMTGNTTARLTGNLYNGTLIEGTDTICVVPPTIRGAGLAPTADPAPQLYLPLIAGF